MKVLLADDNTSVRRILEALLSAWGYDVIRASDGREAWSLLEQPDPPSLLILDWMMPGMDGIDICRSLRAKQSPFPPYILILTCRGHKEDIVAGLEAGADDYVTKPFEAEELRARIQVGKRYVELQTALNDRMYDLQRQRYELRRSNTALKLLNDSSLALTRASRESELLESTCRDIIETGGYRLAWVGFMEGTPEHRFRPVAQAGLENGSLEAMRLAWNETEMAKSPVGMALQSGKPAIVRNIFSDQRYAHRQIEAASRGFSSLIAIPFTISAGYQGVFSVYARDSDPFDADEVKLLVKLADNLAYGINALRTEADRRRIEEELHREHAQAQLYLDVAGVLMVAIDTTGNITLINTKGCSVLGYSQQELLGKNWFGTCTPEDDQARLKAEYEILMQKTLEFKEFFESAVVTKNGNERTLAVHASLLRDQAGKINGLLFSGEDVTERKKAEEALKTSEENYRTLFDKMMVSNARVLAAYSSGKVEQ